MYDIYLIRPFYHTHLITPVLALGYLSSALKAEGYNVKIIDGVNLGISNTVIADLVPMKAMVGITVLSAYYNEANELINLLKQKNCIVILGGPHAICLPEQTLRNTQCDYVIIGEGEHVLGKLISSILRGDNHPSIQGVFHRRSDQVTKAPLIENLNSLLFPDWDQMNPNHIKKAPHGGIVKNFPIGVIMTSRGCPFKCSFCASPSIWEHQIRFRSPENVLDEIEYLIGRYGVKEIHFEDDNLTLKKEHIQEICHGMIKRGIKISWATPNGIRADKVDRELLSLMRESGCYAVSFGIESADPFILKTIKKNESIEKIKKAADTANSLGILTQGFFILGLPGDTVESVKKTIQYARQSSLDKAQFLILDILPGSEIYRSFCDNQQSDYDAAYRGFSECAVTACDLTPQQLKKMQSVAFVRFFLHPRRLLKMLRFVKISQIRYVIRRFKDFCLSVNVER